MQSFVKTSVLATAVLTSSALGLMAEGTATVIVNQPNATVVGTTTEGDLLVMSSTLTIVTAPMAPEAIAAVNATTISADNPAPGPFVGWTVTSADKLPLGKVTASAQAKDGKIANFNMTLPGGRQVLIINGNREIGVKAIELRITEADVMDKVTAPFTTIKVE